MANVNTANGFAAGLPAVVNVLAESAFPLVSGGTVRAVAGLHQDLGSAGNPGCYDGKAFRIRTCYVVTGGTTTNITIKLYLNAGGNTNLTTFTNDTALSTSGALAVNSVTRPIMLDHILIWDSVSATLNGSFNIQSSNTYTAYAAISNQATAVVNQSNLQFFATAIFSATNAANSIKMTEFCLEQL